MASSDGRILFEAVIRDGNWMTDGHQPPLRAYKHGFWFRRGCTIVPTATSCCVPLWPCVLTSTVNVLKYACRGDRIALPSLQLLGHASCHHHKVGRRQYRHRSLTVLLWHCF